MGVTPAAPGDNESTELVITSQLALTMDDHEQQSGSNALTLPSPPALDEAAEIVRSGFDVISRFWHALNDRGIGAQMTEQVALRLLGEPQSTDLIVGMIDQAYKDITVASHFGSILPFDLMVVINGAASLELLQRYAHLVNPQVFLRRDIPSPLLISACLTLFHNQDSPAYAEIKEWYEAKCAADAREQAVRDAKARNT